MSDKSWPIYTIVIVGVIILALGWVAVTNDDTVKGPSESVEIVGQEIPMAVGYVTDNAELIDAKTQEALEDQLKQFADSGSGELAVLTVKSMNGLSVEEYAIRVAEKWKVGGRDTDNGVILIISTDERKVRIEVGRGAAITDAQAGKILDDVMVPKLKRADWAGAIYDGVDAIINLVNKK